MASSAVVMTPVFIKEAGPEDQDNVVDLYLKLYESQREFVGGGIKDGERTRIWIRKLFYQATTGQGVCLLAERVGYPVGVTLAVEAFFPYDTDDGRTAVGYGTFVREGFRREGVAHRLYLALKKRLKEMGYEQYIGAYLHDNLPVKTVIQQVGLKPFQTGVRWDL